LASCRANVSVGAHSSASTSVDDLRKAIRAFLNAWNENPNPFILVGYGGIDPGKAVSLSANVGEDSTGMHVATGQREEQ
jgi:hypothetical protein